MGGTTSQILSNNLPTNETSLQHMQKFANTCIIKAQYEKATDFYEASLIKAFKLFGNSHKIIPILYKEAAFSYCKQGRYTEALDSCRKALDVLLLLPEKDSLLTQQIWSTMGSTAVQQCDYPQAVICYQNMLTSVDETDLVKVAEALEELSLVYMKQGNFTEALETLDDALDNTVKVLGERDTAVADIYNRIGKVYQQYGEYSMAFTYYRKALNLKKEKLGNENVEVAVAHANIASVCKDCEELDDALEYYEKALEIYSQVSECRAEILCPLYCSIGLVYARRGNMKEAMDWFNKALGLCVEKSGDIQLLLGDVYDAMGTGFSFNDKKEAMRYWRKSLETRQKVLGKNHPLIGDLYQKLGLVYSSMSQLQKSLESHKKALEIKLAALEETNPSVGDSYLEIGSLLVDLGKHREGKEYLINCLRVYGKCYGRDHDLYQKAVEKMRAADKREDSLDDSGVFSFAATQDSIEV